MNAIDMVGKKFGRLEVISQAENIGVKTAWLCRCNCGKEKIVQSRRLRAKDGTKSCGCIRMEWLRSRRGEKHATWNGPIRTSEGYLVVRVDGKPKREHRVVAEKAIGRPLTMHEIVHHVNCDGEDNRNENLLVCDKSYHGWLHDRMSKKWAELVGLSRRPS